MCENTIVVGLDGSPSSWEAMNWAAEEARRTTRSLLLVHATAEPTNNCEFGKQLFGEAARRLNGDAGGLVPVDAVLREGNAATVLVTLSRNAALLAVGLGVHGLRPLRIGSVADEVLARTACPTVVVGAPVGVRPNVIIVGATDSPSSSAALDFAGREAQLRGAELKVVRSWSVHERRQPPHHPLAFTSPDIWRAQEQVILDRNVEYLRDAFPTVSVCAQMSGEPVEVALERASLEAALVVVGGRDGETAPHIARIARWAVHHLDCAVAVVGPDSVNRVDTPVRSHTSAHIASRRRN